MTSRTETPAAHAAPDRAGWWRDWYDPAQVSGIEGFLGLETRSRILELGCGVGERTLELARRGHRVLGIDSSDVALHEARAVAKQDRLFVHFLKADSRNIPYSGEFDAVVHRSPSFGHFEAERDDLRSLESARRALKPGGKLLLDLLNREWVLRRFSGAFREGPHLLFHPETGRLETPRPAAPRDSRRPHFYPSFRLYALTEVTRLLDAGGLDYRQVWGAYDGAPYALSCARMIVLAERPREARARPRVPDDLPKAIKIKRRMR